MMQQPLTTHLISLNTLTNMLRNINLKIKLLLILIQCLFLCDASKNIVLIVADDLDLVLDGMTPMRDTLNLIGNRGATFTNCFVASPICCPSRASILTGQYQHNHLTVNNSIDGGCNSASWQTIHEPNTFAAHLKNSRNYRTFYAGKYLNQYGNKKANGSKHIPIGWDWWAGLIGNSKYYDYILSINGTEKRFGNKSNEYLTDVITNLAIDFINSYNANDQPFLMVLAPPAPHAPFTPAVRHNDKYKTVKAKKTPNFNTFPQYDKHWLVRRGPSPLPNDLLPKLDEIYRKRWETLLAVDEMVSDIYYALKLRDSLENTYIIFTSDNGYHIGQFSMPIDKRQPYETDIKVPLLMRGPGISPSTIAAPVSNVDLFATILDIAGMKKPSDGMSLLRKVLPHDRTVLVEYRGESSKGSRTSECPNDNDPHLTLCSKEMACKCQDVANNTYTCIRRFSPDYDNIFCVFEDDERFLEAYNIGKDPYQLRNIAYSINPRQIQQFRKCLKRMSICKNADCILTNANHEYDENIALSTSFNVPVLISY